MTRRLPTCGALAATCLSLFLSSLLFSSSLLADDPPKAADPAAEQRLKDLEGKLDVLTKEIEGLRIGETAPGEKAAVELDEPDADRFHVTVRPPRTPPRRRRFCSAPASVW